MKRRPAKIKMSRSADPQIRRDEQRHRLLQAAQRAIHRGGPQVSMDEIAAEAGITKPIVYRHFGDRRGLAVALRDTSFGTMLGTPSGDAQRDRALARERVAAFFPVVSNAGDLKRVIIGWATAFHMFVTMNRNVYRFLRAEGVLESMWDDDADRSDDPLALALAASLREVFAGRIEDRIATIWAHAIRSMFRGLVDWSSESPEQDRFELEQQFEVLAGALLDGLAREVAAKAPPSAARARPRKRQPSAATRKRS